MASIRKSYFFNSFLWTTVSKLLNAVVSFITVPLLLGLYGKAEYGILSIATACNGYMSLLDMGMNIGAVKFFAQWKEEGRHDLLYRVANTNITFYLIISVINTLVLLILAFWGESLFNVTHEQFETLQQCIYILAMFSVFSWLSTPFNQLLIANKRMAYTMKIQSLLPVLKLILIGFTIYYNLKIVQYFFLITAITALLVFPYAYSCLKERLIISLKPEMYWSDFKVVMMYSLSIFTMSIIQSTSTQTRPILLSILAKDGAGAVADFNIIGAIPLFVTMLGGAFVGIFIPKTSEMVTRNNGKEVESFAYKWTVLTSVIITVLSFPFIVGASEIMSAYVGAEYSTLSVWMILWLFIVILQVHSSPCYSLILAYGKTKNLVICSAVSCIISIIVNCGFAGVLGAGSAVLGYAVYILIGLIYNYIYYYKNLLHLNRGTLLKNFLSPLLVGVIVSIMVGGIDVDRSLLPMGNDSIAYLIVWAIKAFSWLFLYILAICALKIIRYKNGTIVTMYDK